MSLSVSKSEWCEIADQSESEGFYSRPSILLTPSYISELHAITSLAPSLTCEIALLAASSSDDPCS